MKNRGSILRFILIVIAILVILSLLGIDFEQKVNDPVVQRNYIYVKENIGPILGTIVKPIVYLWNEFVVDIIWPIFMQNMRWIRDGEPTDVQRAGNLWTIWNP